jgi:hypothetical protein
MRVFARTWNTHLDEGYRIMADEGEKLKVREGVPCCLAAILECLRLRNGKEDATVVTVHLST